MYGGLIDVAVDNIDVEYNSTPGSLILSSSSAGKNISIINLTDHVLAFSYSGAEAAVPSSDITVNRNQAFVPRQGTTTCDGILISNKLNVYVRSADGTSITAGRVFAFIWGF